MPSHVLYIAKAIEFSVDGVLVRAIVTSGAETFEYAMPFAVLRGCVKRANQVLDEIAERRPVPIRKPRSV